MTEERKLYPLRFCSIQDDYVWGTDEFILADLGYRDSLVRDGWLAANSLSEVMDTYLDRVVGDRVYEMYGRQFPVQVKRISCKGRMPLRVHPDDVTASERYDALGREKLWYVLKASKDAKLFLGFRQACDASQLMDALEDGSIETLLNVVNPRPGDSFHIAPGTIHGAAGEIELVEVSQSSALDFCVFSWGQQLGSEEFDDALNVIDALDFIDYAPYRNENLISQFSVRKLDLREPIHILGENNDSFAVYHCLYGEAVLKLSSEDAGELVYRLKGGETLLVPSEVDDFILAPAAQTTALLEILVENTAEKDEYINPDVPEKLPEDEDE